MRKMRMIVLFVTVVVSWASVVSAVPVDPINVRPQLVNPAPGSERDLQIIMNDVFGVANAPDVYADQETAGMWQVEPPGSPFLGTELYVEFAGNAAINSFGIWSGIDSMAITSVRIFDGSARSGATAMLKWDLLTGTLKIGNPFGDTGVISGTYSGIDPTRFGFYLHGANNYTAYSVDMLNGGTPQMLAYNVGPEWLLAFEDLPYASADRDYNDMVVLVQSITPVPEPGTLALLGAGLIGLGGMGLYRRRRN